MPIKSSERIQLSLHTHDATSGVTFHENAEDRYVLSAALCRGSVKLECEGGLIYDGDVRPGFLRLLPPGERVKVTKRSRSATLRVSFPGPEFREIVPNDFCKRWPTSLSLVHPILKLNYHVESLCRMLRSAKKLDDSQRQLFTDGLSHSLLALLLDAQCSEGAASLRSKGGLSDAELARCMDYALARLGEKLCLTAWASTLNMSASEFARRFQLKTSVAPYAWFMTSRIERAKEMLSQTDLSTIEVSLEVGFCSQSHFTEAFRRRVGLSPGRWRSTHRI